LIHNENIDADQLILDAIDAGAEDVDVNEVVEITTPRTELFTVRQQLEKTGYVIQSAALQRIASTSVAVSEEDALMNFKLMDKLEDNDDVANVFSNMEMNDATLLIAENMI
jgi:transcriptional/translational regulatory protein YebC/TACO1